MKLKANLFALKSNWLGLLWFVQCEWRFDCFCTATSEKNTSIPCFFIQPFFDSWTLARHLFCFVLAFFMLFPHAESCLFYTQYIMMTWRDMYGPWAPLYYFFIITLHWFVSQFSPVAYFHVYNKRHQKYIFIFSYL